MPRGHEVRTSLGSRSPLSRAGDPHFRFFPVITFRRFVLLVLLFTFFFAFYAALQLSRSKGLEKDEVVDVPHKIKERKITEVTPDVCKRLQRQPWVCAHGGDTAEAPPNTRAAYELALAAGVECVEVDVTRAADRELLALHDRDLQAFSGQAELRVGQVTLAQVRGYDPERHFSDRYKGQQVLTFLEALQILCPTMKQVIVDVKTGPGTDLHLAADIILAIEQASCSSSALVWSKDDALVTAVNSLRPALRTGYIVMKDSVSGQVSELLRLAAPHVVGVHWGLATPELMQAAQRGPKEVQVWTVDTDEEMRRMVELGVAAIVTGRPRRLQRVIRHYIDMCKDELKRL